MASKQTNTNEYIAEVIAEAVRVAILTMSIKDTARTENMGPRMSWNIMKQPTFDCSAKVMMPS